MTEVKVDIQPNPMYEESKKKMKIYQPESLPGSNQTPPTTLFE